ncbi:hypothetical protein [Polyangium spumosum]|uniref:Uncharacterized protein n=1 Tax=Polyangium spumosum TaxID=889282 RepID=A0A6N7PUW0_9BACT|nr:hypothetical protein [Polyangium spumosum]MRG95773.1 hypothetical protein [Polyangium spumosum]
MRVPVATAERVRACIDELGGELGTGYYTFDTTVKVDEEGRVVEVKGKGVPHPELAICMRIALRSMTVPEELLRVRALRVPEPAAKTNGQAPDEPGLVGHPAVAVIVAVALADVFIEVGTTVIVLAAAVEMSGEIAKTVRKEDDDDDDPCQKHVNACLEKPLADRPGSVHGETRCRMCWLKCTGTKTKEWPKKVRLTRGYGSCEYWLPGWPR